MARKFEFRQNFLELNIAGEKFEIDAFEPSLTKRITNYRLDLGKQGDILSNASESEMTPEELEKEMEKAIKLCTDIIDDLLGDKACQRIFKDRPINFLDAVDVTNFIMSETDNYIQNDVRSKYSSNRAQRRSNKKK